MKKILLTGVLIIATLLLAACGEDFERIKKDWDSNLNGGLNRTIEVYSYTGEKIKEFEGKTDVVNRKDGTVKFDLNGKRIIIRNAIVIMEEK